MADLNVFALTNMELHKDDDKTSKKPSKTARKKSVKESVTRKRPKKIPFNIPANKIRLESIQHFHEDTDSEATADYTPEDDVVLVIDPEMDEVPEDVEAAEDMAEDMIGNHVCKCAICGANYVTDAEISEDFEMEDETCPVCGETGEQIVIGVITPTEELSDEDAEEIDDVEIEDEDGDIDFEETDEVEDDEDFDEAISRSKRRTAIRRVESRKARSRRSRVAESNKSTTIKRSTVKRPMAKRPATRTQAESLQFDDVTLNRMLTRFAKENYANVRSVKITKGSSVRGKLTLEGVVKTTKGATKTIKFVCESFKPSKRMTISFKEIGPFTESVKNVRPTFVLECVMTGKCIVPKTLKYSFKAKDRGVKESKATYRVSGTVLSESTTARKKSIKSESVKRMRRARRRSANRK